MATASRAGSSDIALRSPPSPARLARSPAVGASAVTWPRFTRRCVRSASGPSLGKRSMRARRDARAWQRFDELLDAMAGVARALGSATMPLEDFLGQVVAAAERDLGSESEPAGGVRALSVLDARGLDFDVVYVMGLDDGTFP